MFNKSFYQVFLLIFIPYAVLVTAGFVLFAYIQYQHNIKLIKKNELLQLDLVRKSVVRDLENILPDIEVLANERHIQQFFFRDDESSRKLAEQEIESFSKHKRIYRQIRLLDNKGKERIRVDYVDEKISKIDTGLLQDKSDRYYFKESINLGQNELYISPLDLNIEKNTIEIPYNPTIRFAMPVYNDQQNISGIIVLNYIANNLLGHFDEMLAGSYGHIALLNQDGFWLRSHKPEREWAFMFNNDITFSQQHPQEWQLIASRNKGQIHTSDGLFSFVTIYPSQLIGGYSDSEMKDNHLGHHHIHPKSYSWKIVSDVPARKFLQIRNDLIFGLFGLIWLVLMIMGIFTSWYLTMTYLERRKLRNQMELHAKIYGSSTEGIIITDANEKIVDINAAFENISGFACQEVIGKQPSVFSSGRHERSFYIDLWQQIDNNGYWEGEIYNRHKNGSIYTEWIRISAIKDGHGKVTNYIALASDITQKKMTEEQLIKYAHYDPLTGAHNRLSFDERFSHDLLLAKRNNDLLALLYLDLDKFKPINDTYGHQTGDSILQMVTQRLLNNIRSTDTLARLGGDEFAIILSQVEHEQEAETIADTLAYIVREPCMIDDKELSVGVSIGVAIYPIDGDDEQQLLEKADQSMFKKKQLAKLD